MKNLDVVGFKFKIGDIVYHKLKTSSEYKPEQIQKTPLLIIERMAQECHGGVQLKYLCRVGTSASRGLTFDPSNNYVMMEMELEA